MKKVAMVALVVFLPGCPGATSPFVGTWIVTVINPSGLEVHADGTADSFPTTQNGPILAGDIRWREVNGDFVLQQSFSSTWIWAGKLSSPTTMGGYRIGYAGPNTGTVGTWSAVKQ